MKKKLIIGLFLITISISLAIYNEIKNKPVNIYSITNSASKDENVNVYLDASFIAGSIKSNNKNYYVIFGEGVQYLVSIDDKQANELNNYLLNNPEDTKRIKGITKLIPNELINNGIKFIENYLESSHNHTGEVHEHNITEDDFYHYFGYVYFDTSNNFDIMIILIIISGLIGIIFIADYLNKRYHLI